VHLTDPVLGYPIAQRDMYPGQGLLLTSWLDIGDRIVNSYRLQIPQTAVTPSVVQVITGLYDYTSKERLPLKSGQDSVQIAELALADSADSLPNPVQIDFENELRLRGFELDRRRVAAGEPFKVTLHWEAQRPLEEDYTFFAQVVAEDTTRWASFDLLPQPGTSTWQPGTIVSLPMELAVDENTPAGLYPLIIGAYVRGAEGEFARLQVRSADGRLTDDFLNLTQIRVDDG
jgi:hypothetical protein